MTYAFALGFHVSISVYQGVKSFYKEEDETVAVNVYGKSKVAAELLIKDKCQSFAILRSSIIFGPQTVSPLPKTLPIQVLLNTISQRYIYTLEFIELAMKLVVFYVLVD